MEEKKLSSDAYRWAYDRYIKGDPEMEKYLEELGVKADIARQLYNLRNQAGLTQEQLADLVGTNASVIDDIEEADYEGDFLGMASRIANALHRRVEVRLVPVEDMDAPVESQYSIHLSGASHGNLPTKTLRWMLKCNCRSTLSRGSIQSIT